LTWRNANAIRFVRLADGSIGLLPEQASLLTPPLSAAIRAYQETLSIFVSAAIDAETFYAELSKPDEDAGFQGFLCELAAEEERLRNTPDDQLSDVDRRTKGCLLTETP
jgi:hypothetical protein